jgi:hypothetical protein
MKLAVTNAELKLSLEPEEDQAFLCGPQRISASSAFKLQVNAESAEIRRGPQRYIQNNGPIFMILAR